MVRRDDGAGSVLVLVAVGLLVALGLGGLTLARGLLDRQRVAVAADVLALSAARVPWGTTAPCDLVRREASARSLTVLRCGVLEGVVHLEISAPGPWGIPLVARARASAISAST